MTKAERIKIEFIAKRMERAVSHRFPLIEPTADDNRRDLKWWLDVLDAKAFLFSMNGSAAWLFPHYELRLAPLTKRVVVESAGVILVDSHRCFEFHETAHARQIYVPREEVRFQHLFETETLTFCPFKGLAKYYGVKADGNEVDDAFWSYEEIYDKFPDNGNASDIVRLKGMLSPDRSRVDVKILDA